jgi:uncharacterized ubiquitin-like protein YukD
MKTMKKYLPLILILIVASGLFLFKKYSPTNVSVPVRETVSEQKINLAIDFGNKDLKNYDLTIRSEDTAYSVLKTVTEKEKIILQVKQYDFGVFVEKIGDFESTAKKSWIYYLNGVSGQIAADQQKLKNGDKVEWKYEIAK